MQPPNSMAWAKDCPDMGLEVLPRDGADHPCGWLLAWGEGPQGDGVCRAKARRAVSEEFVRKTDYMNHRAICEDHIAAFEAALGRES